MAKGKSSTVDNEWPVQFRQLQLECVDDCETENGVKVQKLNRDYNSVNIRGVLGPLTI